MWLLALFQDLFPILGKFILLFLTKNKQALCVKHRPLLVSWVCWLEPVGSSMPPNPSWMCTVWQVDFWLTHSSFDYCWFFCFLFFGVVFFLMVNLVFWVKLLGLRSLKVSFLKTQRISISLFFPKKSARYFLITRIENIITRLKCGKIPGLSYMHSYL